MIWVYYIEPDGDIASVAQVIEKYNTLEALADKWPDAIYFEAELVCE